MADFESYEPMETDLVAPFSRIRNADDALAFANGYGFLGFGIGKPIPFRNVSIPAMAKEAGTSEAVAAAMLEKWAAASGLVPGFIAWYRLNGENAVKNCIASINESFAAMCGEPTDPTVLEVMNCGGEPISKWLEQATALKKVLDLWKAIRERDAKVLRTMEWQPPDKLDWAVDDIFEPIAWVQGKYRKDPLAIAQVHLAQTINSHLRPTSSSTFVCLGSDGNLKLHNSPMNLLTAIWMQLSQMVTGIRRMRSCGHCGELMDVTNCTRRKKFHDACSQHKRTVKYRGTARYRARLKARKTRNQ
jgi:hypothetical protein